MRVKLFDLDYDRFTRRLFAALEHGDEVVLPPTQDRAMQLEEAEATQTLAELPTPAKLRELALLPTAKISFFTSGSTGTPKRIEHSLRALLCEAENHLTHPQRKATFTGHNTTIITTVSHQHFYGLIHQVLLPLLGELSVRAPIIRSPEALEVALRETPRAILLATPTFLNAILTYRDQYQFAPTLVDIVSSGALLDEKTAAATFDAFGISPFEIFGATEVGGAAWRRQAISKLWTAQPNVTLSKSDSGALCVASNMTDAEGPVAMGDGVEFIEGTSTFKLLGRLDRMVKIFEERVSLPEEEETLMRHPLIQDGAYLLLEQNLLGLVFVPTQEGADVLQKIGRKAFLAQLREAGIRIPKFVRIEPSLIRNPQGKLTNGFLRKQFDCNIPSPICKRVTVEENAVEVVGFFARGSIYFRGHFDDTPILPGVVQLYIATRIAANFLGMPTTLARATRVKYTYPILPDQDVLLQIKQESPTKCRFAYFDATTSKPLSSGILNLEQEPTA